MQNQIKKTQSGYSLIELSISLAIIGVVIAGSIIGVQSILRSNSVNKAIAQTNTATNKIVSRLARDANYASATTEALTAQNLEIWESNSISTVATVRQVQHAFANRVHVAPLGAESNGVAANQGYIYTLTGIPTAACAELAIGIESLALAMSIINEIPTATAPVGLSTGTNIVKTPPGTGSVTFSTAVANAACGTAQSTATISFLVPRR